MSLFYATHRSPDVHVMWAFTNEKDREDYVEYDPTFRSYADAPPEGTEFKYEMVQINGRPIRAGFRDLLVNPLPEATMTPALPEGQEPRNRQIWVAPRHSLEDAYPLAGILTESEAREEARCWNDDLWMCEVRIVGDTVRASDVAPEMSAQELFNASPDLEEDDLADLVSRFSDALLDKLRAAEVKYGHNNAWLLPNWQADLCSQLREHVEKGDPRDVAAYCAFAWHHGWSIAAPAEPSLETPSAWQIYDAGAMSDGQPSFVACKGSFDWNKAIPLPNILMEINTALQRAEAAERQVQDVLRINRVHVDTLAEVQGEKEAAERRAADADRMRGEALLALGLEEERANKAEAIIAREKRISDSDMMALLRRRVLHLEKEALAAKENNTPERKEPWASVITVATNRAVRKFQAEFPGHGLMSAVIGSETEGDYSIRIASLKDPSVIRDYHLLSLGIEPADLDSP